MDINSLCRLCAKETEVSLCIDVFSDQGIQQKVEKKIRLCLPIIVKETDEFPKRICLNCLSNLDASYELYRRCLEAQSIIKNMAEIRRQCRGDMVKVFSHQELLQKANELQDKLSEKRTALRMGNTVFSLRDSSCQTNDIAEDEQKPKKRKQEAVKVSSHRGGGMMYPMGAMGQQYMLMPSPSMPSAVYLPPQGQFISHIPTIQSFPVQQMPAVAPVSSASSPVADVAARTMPQITAVAAPQQIESPQPSPPVQNAAPAPAVTPTLQQQVPQASPPVISQPSTPTTVQQPQIASVQGSVHTFSNTTTIASTPVTVKVTPSNRAAGKPAQTTPSNTTPKITSIQGNIKAFQQSTFPTSAPFKSTTSTDTSLSTFDTLLQTPTTSQLSKANHVQPQSSAAVSLDEDEDEYGVDDPEPFDNDDDDQQPVEDKIDVDTAVIEVTEESVPENRESAVEEKRDGPTNGSQDDHMCPYCHKSFPEDVILHHKKLHFRQTFFSCITCNKNFRTEKGLESHRCE